MDKKTTHPSFPSLAWGKLKDQICGNTVELSVPVQMIASFKNEGSEQK